MPFTTTFSGSGVKHKIGQELAEVFFEEHP